MKNVTIKKWSENGGSTTEEFDCNDAEFICANMGWLVVYTDDGEAYRRLGADVMSVDIRGIDSKDRDIEKREGCGLNPAPGACQPEEVDHHWQQMVVVRGVVRWRKNAIVDYLVEALDDAWGGDMAINRLASMNFSSADWRQFTQLLGYSVSGWGGIDFVSRDVADRADRMAARVMEEESQHDG